MTNRFWKILVISIVVAATSEVSLTIAAFASMTHRHGVPKDMAAQRLLLTKWLLLPFLSVDFRIKPYTGGRQRYLGELTYDSSEWIDLLVPDSLLGARPGRSITAFENMGLGDKNGSVYVTNDEGFVSVGDRDFHYGLAHPAQRYRIIIVGGSTVFGWGSGTPDKNLPASLSSSLKRQESDRYEVINAGVPGHDSSQEFLYVTSELIHYNPNLIIVYDGWNDEFAAELSPSGPKVRADGINFFKSTDHLVIEERVKASYSILGSAGMLARNIGAHERAAMHHTGLFWLISGLTHYISQRVIPDRPKPDLKYDPARIELYERNLTSMIDFADRNGVRVALFLQPIMWIDGRKATPDEIRVAALDSDAIPVRRAFYADARTMFARLQKRYQRPERVCIEDLSQILGDTTDTIYGDSGHLLGVGNRIVADEIAKRLAACGELRN